MDLLSGLRKGDSSRGGRAEFSWDAVKEDKDRENYLGHSLMAPVGRWQRGKDLTWYAKSKSDGSAMTAEEKRKEEIRQIKEAEQDALAEALGFPVVRRQMDAVNEKDVQKAIREAGVGDEEEQEGRGVGFGKRGTLKEIEGRGIATDEGRRIGEYQPLEGMEDGKRGRKDDKDRERQRRHRSRSDRSRRGRDRDHDRERRHRHRHHNRSRSRSRRRHHRDDEGRDGNMGRRHGEGRERHERRRSSRSKSPRRRHGDGDRYR